MSLSFTTVESIMDDVKKVSVDSTSSVTEAAVAILKGGKGAVVVLEKKKAIGIITERDVLEKVVTVHKEPSKTLVVEVMSSPLITIDVTVSLSEAIALMSKKGIRRLLVTRHGKVEGIVTQRDILLKLMELFKYLLMHAG